MIKPIRYTEKEQSQNARIITRKHLTGLKMISRPILENLISSKWKTKIKSEKYKLQSI